MRTKTKDRLSSSFFYKFMNTDPEAILKEYQTKSDKYWRRAGQNLTLKLFKQMAQSVPAYKDFLKKSEIKPEKISTYKDLVNVPPIDKPTYIDKYNLNELCWDGKIDASYMMSVSSGSTGVPYFWPRSEEQNFHGALISELIYRAFFEMHRKSTLYIITFGMGMWIAGTYMMMVTQWIAQKGYPVTVATPGINKNQVLRLINLGKKCYQQIVLVGLSQFIKDIIDTGIKEGMNWKTINVKFIFSAEAFTERWRSYLEKKVRFDTFTDTINLYGSADVGINAHETPTTILLRRLATENKKIRYALFNSERVPSINQFDPSFRHFERLREELLVSYRSGIPLVRYNTKDIGEVLYFSDVATKLKLQGLDLQVLFKQKIDNSLIWHLPIVYLFGRGKFSATFYGITLFPEFIKYVLDNPSLEEYLTGKFVITTEEKKDLTQELHLRVELNDGVKQTTALRNKVKQFLSMKHPMLAANINIFLKP